MEGVARQRPSMMDVARVAGVSHQTVSRVLNDPGSVTEATRQRVQDAIDAIGYRRNMSARALKRAKSNTIGVVISDSRYFGPSSALSAVEEAARAQGFATQVAVAQRGQAESSTVSSVRHLVEQDVEGLIVVASRESVSTAARELAGRVPVVIVEADGSAAERVSVVSVDQRLGATQATQHLIALGHRRIAHIAGPLDWFDSRSRRQGWQATLDDAGLVAPEVIVGDWSVRSGYDAARQMIDDLPDAVFAANDQMATGFIHALWEAGVRVPDDIAVIGFDDLESSRYLCPPLSSVTQPFADLGYLAVDRLFALISGGEPSESSLSPTLRVRASSDPSLLRADSITARR